MIRSVIFLGLWAVLPTPGQVGSAALYTDFESKPAPAVFQALRQEVDFLMAPNGLHFEWRSLRDDDSTSWTDLAVVKFSGRCAVLPFAINSRIDQRLGWTHVSDKVVLPFAEVDCDAIRTFVRQELSAKPQATREATFGRAVGRVVAHELLHIFAESESHGDHGVDHPSLTVKDLLSDNLEFSELEPTVRIVQAGHSTINPKALLPVEAGHASYLRDGCGSCHGKNAEGSPHGPKLRTARTLNPIVLAAKLAKSQDKMWQRARNLKIAPPSLTEDEISDLVHFLNGL